MIRIGILGADSSHASAFSKLCNFPEADTGSYHFPEVRVTAIYGEDMKQAKEVALACNISEVVTLPDELFSKVDGVMVLFRDGNVHLSYALPFIESGIPVWIDKPVTVTLKDSDLLLEAAAKSSSLITGGSTCKYNKEVLELKKMIDRGDFGQILSGYLNFPCDINSPYNGIFFYAPHMVEMMFAIFGYEIHSIICIRHKDTIRCIAKYEEFSIILDFTNHVHQSFCMIHGNKKSHVGEIKVNTSTYKAGLEQFITMLKTKNMPLPLSNLTAVTKVLTAINDSMPEGKEIFLHI